MQKEKKKKGTLVGGGKERKLSHCRSNYREVGISGHNSFTFYTL